MGKIRQVVGNADLSRLQQLEAPARVHIDSVSSRGVQVADIVAMVAARYFASLAICIKRPETEAESVKQSLAVKENAFCVRIADELNLQLAILGGKDERGWRFSPAMDWDLDRRMLANNADFVWIKVRNARVKRQFWQPPGWPGRHYPARLSEYY